MASNREVPYQAGSADPLVKPDLPASPIYDDDADPLEGNAAELPIDALPSERQPKGDHNRRLALGLDADQFALEAGITPTQVIDYEQTPPDHTFDLEIARRYGLALERLEANPPASQRVINGPTA